MTALQTGPASTPDQQIMTRLESRRAIALVGRREVRSRIGSRAFIVGLATTVALIFGVFGLGTYFSGDDPLQIGLVGEQPVGAVSGLDAVADISETEFELVDFSSRADAELAVRDGVVDGAVVDGTDLIVRDSATDLVALVSPAWQQASLIGALGSAGLADEAIARSLTEAAPLSVVELAPDPDADERESLAFVSVILLFVAIQLAGAYILMGVFEEKSTKVVELVLSSVRARDLLLGKVIGVGILGLVQIVVLAGSALTAAAIFGSSAVPSVSVGMLVTGIVWFVIGYLLYGSIFAAGASLAPRQEDAQSTLAPVSVLLMLSYFGAIFAASDSESTLATVISWVPFTAPFAMPGRFAAGDAQWWEVVGSMAIAAVAAFVVLRLAERIYVRSVIHTDRKLGWREAWSLQS